MKNILKTIRQALNAQESVDQEVTDFLNLIQEGVYTRIDWPEVQELMDEPWFQEDAILDTYGEQASTYFIPLGRLF